MEARLNCLPRFGLEPLDAQSNTALIAIVFHHKDLDLVAALQHIGWMTDASPTQFADMDQPFQSAEVHERAEIAQISDSTCANIAFAQLIQNVGARAGLNLCRPLRQDEPIVHPIQFNHTQHQFMPDPARKFAATNREIDSDRNTYQLT